MGTNQLYAPSKLLGGRLSTSFVQSRVLVKESPGHIPGLRVSYTHRQPKLTARRGGLGSSDSGSLVIHRVNYHRQFDHKYRSGRPQIDTGDTENDMAFILGYMLKFYNCLIKQMLPYILNSKIIWLNRCSHTFLYNFKPLDHIREIR